MCRWESHSHAAALGTLQLDVDHRSDRSLGLLTNRLWFRFGKRSKLVRAVLAEGLLGARRAHRTAGLADDVRPCSAGEGALAGRIESGGVRHLAAEGCRLIETRPRSNDTPTLSRWAGPLSQDTRSTSSK